MFSLIARAAAVLALGLGVAWAQETGPFGGFKHDNSLPIEVTADSLEVRQAESKAIFTGEVIAGQGTLRLTADSVTVTYAADGQSEAGSGGITHMRADGNVFLSNGTETAKGAWAVYDVVAGTMRMGGGVILTQGCNAISSDALFIDLNAGVGRSEGRVRVIFTPESETCN